MTSRFLPIGASLLLTGFTVSLAALVGAGGCSSSLSGVNESGDGGLPTGPGVGATCNPSTTCRSGLACDPTSSTCQPAGTTAQGSPCVIGDECTSGICAPGGVCGAPGTGVAGGACAGDADCGKGLRCGFDGTDLTPRCLTEGEGDIGQMCAAWRDCRQGLVCTSTRCEPLVIPPGTTLPSGLPPFLPDPTTPAWAGETCPAPLTSSPITAVFELPSNPDTTETDFYRLPFPNDAARDATGHVDYSKHPHFVVPEVGVDVLASYLTALDAEPFGAYATVYFRFNGQFDFSTIDPSVPAGGGDPILSVVDVTPGASTFGNRRGLSDFVTNGRNKYICDNFVAVRPNRGDPYRAGTYAVILKSGVKATDGTPVQQDADFTAMIGPAAPSDPTKATAYAAYKPLRDLMTMKGWAPSDLVVATVFTVGDPQTTAAKLKASVAAAPTKPSFGAWVQCGPGVASPCPQSTGDRNCTTTSPDYIELQSLVQLPIFQRGTEPYSASPDGAIDTTGATLTPVTTEQVCASLTIPKNAKAPAAGFPIAIYAHGTGGSFRTHTLDGSAKNLSSVTVGSGATATTMGFAMLGIDQVEHGTRRGSSMASPNDLFFNFTNAQAARYNPIQGAADQHSLVLAVQSLASIPASVTGTAIKLDPKTLVYWGHSQGATEGAIFLAYDTTVKGAVLSGEGGGLIDALTTKTNPVDIKDGLWIALGEDTAAAVDTWHPALSLLQSWEDPADPVHFARNDALATATALLAFPRSVFQPWGSNDTYTPWEVQAGYFLASPEAWVGPEVDRGGLSTTDDPSVASASGNLTSNGTKITVITRQYAPDSTYDGHFVAFDNATASSDVAR
jgi:hypothetical protein